MTIERSGSATRIEVASDKAALWTEAARKYHPEPGGIATWLFFHPEERERIWWFDDDGYVRDLTA